MFEFLYSGLTDVGYGREVNEDTVTAIKLGEDAYLFLVLDGVGSKTSNLQPSLIVANEIEMSIRRIYERNKELLFSNAEHFISEAFYNANRVLGAFRRANEEQYAGFAAVATCVMVTATGNLTVVHTGNTRLYVIRNNKEEQAVMKQLTIDHTKAKDLLNEGKITEDEYHVHPDRLIFTSGFGESYELKVQSFTIPVRDNDMYVLTSDGIHYAVRKDAMMQLIFASENLDNASRVLIEAAKSEKYADNMSNILIYCKEVQK